MAKNLTGGLERSAPVFERTPNSFAERTAPVTANTSCAVLLCSVRNQVAARVKKVAMYNHIQNPGPARHSMNGYKTMCERSDIEIAHA
ncbi:MAG: hypothetical protein WBW61_04590 [Rhodanobacteraceae bacterium]